MDKEMYHVQIGDTIREYPKGTTYLAIAKEYRGGRETSGAWKRTERRLCAPV